MECQFDASCPNFCSLHGECINGECKCGPGWGAADCSLKLAAKRGKGSSKRLWRGLLPRGTAQ